MTTLWRDDVPTPLGTLTIVATGDALCALDFPAARSRMLARIRARFPGIAVRRRRDPHGYATRLRAYFAGDLAALDAIAVDAGGTPFEERCWQALRTIPSGTTTTYRKLAAVVRHPRAIRAVGRANARNPISIVVPCHRLVGSDGDLRGYGGGLWRKQWLLEHEGAR